MNLRRRLHLSLVSAAAFIAAGGAERSLFGADAKADAAKRRAEIERKSQEIKKKAEEHRQHVQEQQRAVRERLGVQDPAGGTAAGTPATTTTTTTTTSSPTSAEELRKKLNLPEPKSAVRAPGRSTTAFGMTKTSVAYAPKRGQEFAFLVEILAREAGMQKQWIGKPYFATIYSDVGPSFAEMFCIGSLTSRIRSSADRPWTTASTEDIEFPEKWLFGSFGVLGGETTSLFDEPTLPLQLSAIIPLEELIFPRMPLFSDNPADDKTTASKYYVRGGKPNSLGYSPITDLDGEIHRVCRVEDESSATPRIVNERSFSCPDKEISFSLRQVGIFDAKEGMILSVDIDYLLELEGKVPAKVKVRRLYGDDLAAARAEALQKLPLSKWPAYYRRVPADTAEFSPRFPRTAGEVRAGQRVSVSIAVNERNAKGSRDFLARALDGGAEDKVRVRLDGSGEELDVSPTRIRLPK
jgi:hypothetical protein